MKKIIATIALSLFASAAFAQGVPVSASYEAPVSATAVASDVKDTRRPGPTLMDCCGVPVSAPQVVKAEEDSSGALSMAGLGFGLFGLVGITKLARRKKQKGTETL